MSSEVDAAARAAVRVRAAIAGAARGLVEREVLLELIALAAVAEEHVLVIGEPGTAKSEAVRRMARAFGGRYFEYLLGRFTEPNEIFGPIDLLKLQQGTIETQTAGMLPEADVAFLDEVFLGSTAILNALLTLLNERRFRRGRSDVAVPLRLCVGASNALPEDVALAAFADRFLVRVFVAPVPDAELEALLAAGRTAPPREAGASLDDLSALTAARRAIDLAPVQPLLAEAVRKLRRAGIHLTDRRIVRAQNLVGAAAAVRGAAAAGPEDLWPILYVVPTAAEQESAREELRLLLAASESSLSAAALDASAAPRVRAERIARAAEEVLALETGAHEREAWKLRLEGIAREIDASFAPGDLPVPLPALRARIAEILA